MLTIVVPIIVVVAVVIGLWTWYRRAVAGMAADGDRREIGGSRLTAERLRRLPTPPWRVVPEIGGPTLGDVDHVVIGPPGVVAIRTIVGETTESSGAAPTIHSPEALAAVARSDVDELLAGTGVSCSTMAHVHWGRPDADLPPATEIAAGLVVVEGQRLDDWLLSLPGAASSTPLTSAQVDLAWRAIVTGVGRPDPLA